MRRLTSFSDSNNFIIRGFTPYYYNKGTTYRDKLINKLSLDYVLSLNTNYNTNDLVSIKDVERKQIKCCKLYYDTNEYDNIKHCKYYKCNKGKSKNKNKCININKYPPKTDKRQKGYDYKLFNIEQNTPDIFIKGLPYVYYCYYYGDDDDESVYSYNSCNNYWD